MRGEIYEEARIENLSHDQCFEHRARIDRDRHLAKVSCTAPGYREILDAFPPGDYGPLPGRRRV
jgi:hypothetical protein